MARPKFKQRCVMCKNNMVIMYSSRQFPICSPCQMKRIDVEIKDKKMAAFFDAVPREFYEENGFLRNIKESYVRFENLTEKQREAFLRVVQEMKEGPKEEDAKGEAAEKKETDKEEKK